MHCVNCGKSFQELENFCSQCGTPLTGSGIQNRKTMKKTIIVTLVLTFIGFLSITALGIIYLTGKQGEANRRTQAISSAVTNDLPFKMAPAEVSVKKPKLDALNEAVSKNNLNKVIELVSDGNEYDSNNALMLAVTNKNQKITEKILESGVNVNVMRFGKTALYLAITNKDIEMVKFLLDSGADPDRSTVESEIWEAVKLGSKEIVALLLEHGADPNKLRVDNKYLLTVSKELGFTEISEMLLNAGAKESKSR
ncbi:ankyrin repeat domain-containing protein [Paenibacillus whitsoniae]|uniref:DUF2116 family Zn-ribbon domain-containing protein n=1 Tax=Paenibacillus whitsoniae TaxID=2496558 RepID=A0A430JC71_9BACL|nr:DUF2116 family Zn-ribbon domain-containing protein [Paenibacillus whitsoniae]RTE08638.1 DUF2116 family Zn-ribbon domain-containing protein [Paenibacillus whitsoniae]